MNRRAPFVTATLLVLLSSALSCGGDDIVAPSEISLQDIAGSWTVTEFSVVSKANTRQAFDLIQFGGSIAMAIQPSGTFSGTAVIPGALLGQPEPLTIPVAGVIRLTDPAHLRIDFIPEVPPIFRTMTPALTLIDDVMQLSDEGATYDFDGDGIEEPATYNGRFVRR